MSNRVKRLHMYAGVDLIGAKTSMAENRNISLEATAIGIKMISKGTNRIVVIPYSNVKGFEMYPEEQESMGQIEQAEVVAPAAKRRGRPPAKAE